MDYNEFLATKAIVNKPVGVSIEAEALNDGLFDFQKAITRRLLKLGRGAGFAATGLGKSRMQLEWSRQISEGGDRGLIVAPLAVAKQTVKEALKIGLIVKYCESMADVGNGLNITNYERLHRFDPHFGAIALDESSIIKNSSSATFNFLKEFVKGIHYRSAWTATPSPNDPVELGTHAEILGIMLESEVKSTYFTHDGGDANSWKLMPHGEQEFYKWLCSWSVWLRKPSDIGFSDDGYILPELKIIEHIVEGKLEPEEGMLIAMPAKGLNDQRKARKLSLSDRVQVATDLVNNSDEQWLAFCNLNSEGDALESAIDGAIQVAGKDKPEYKEQAMIDFADGIPKALVSKPEICGYGMNFQQCHNVVFVGVSHSWEAWHQSIRRLWRFGQQHPVNCHVIYSSHEGAVMQNLWRKEKQVEKLLDGVMVNMKDFMDLSDASTMRQSVPYEPVVQMTIPNWLKNA